MSTTTALLYWGVHLACACGILVFVGLLLLAAERKAKREAKR